MEPCTLTIAHLLAISITSSVSLVTFSSTKKTSLVSSLSSGVRAISNVKESSRPSVLGGTTLSRIVVLKSEPGLGGNVEHAISYSIT